MQNYFEIEVKYKIWDKWEDPISLKTFIIIEITIANKEPKLWFCERENDNN